MKSSLHRLPEREALFPPGSATSVPPGLRRSGTDLDIAIPVYDAERILAAGVRRLHSFLSEEFPFSWRIIIADKASTDRTPVIAARLSDAAGGANAAPGVQGARASAPRCMVGQRRAGRVLHAR